MEQHMAGATPVEAATEARLDYRLLGEASSFVRSRWADAQPLAAVILGSGWGGAITAFKCLDKISYADIPGLGQATSVGHAGLLWRAELAGVETLIFQGRRHYYEGLGYNPMAVPIAVSRDLGVKVMMLCNATGGMAEHLSPGDLMLVRDHINTSGNNPLIGPHIEGWGERFPDMSTVYDPSLQELLRLAAQDSGIVLKEGVVQVLAGPAYETPAEVRFMHSRLGDVVRLMQRALLIQDEQLKQAKLPGLPDDLRSAIADVPEEIFTEGRGDAAAMSIANGEAVMANAWGLKVMAVSCIANFAAGRSAGKLTGDEVVEELEKAMPSIKRLIESAWRRLSVRD